MKHSTVIDIGSSKVACISAGTAPDGALIIHGVETRPYSGYRLGMQPPIAPLAEALEDALAALQDNTGLRIRNVSIGAPAPFVKTAVTRCEVPVISRSGKVGEQDLSYLLACAADFDAPAGFELMHSTPFDYVLDGMALEGSPVGMSADKLGASFCHAFVGSRFSGALVGALDAMGVGVNSFVSTGMACAAFTIPFAERMSGAVLIDCGGTHTDVSAIRGNALLRTESIGIGGLHFTNDVAFGLRLPRSVAEDIKRRYVFGLDYGSSTELVRIPSEGIFEIERSAVQMIIEARAEELASSICEALDSVEGGLPIGAPVYLVGGGVAPLRGSAEYLSRRTGRDILINTPKTSRMSSVSSLPALALAQFMLYGGSGGARSGFGRGRILENIRELFTAGSKR